MKSRLRILYAEDNAHDADLTRVCLAERAPEFDLEIVQTGQECLERLSLTGCDLLLLDHRLPDMDGLDVLRALVRTGFTAPVILVTGSGDEELVVKALHLGASDYVPKIGNYLQSLPELLRGVLKEHSKRRRQGLATSGPRRVLYVEHYEMDIDLTLRHFAETAPLFELDIVRTSVEALAHLRQPPRYDAALIDLRMPDQSGLDFVREAKRLDLALPPFVMISGKGDEAAAIASLTLGAVDYITKRDGYLDQLPHTIDRAIAYDRLNRVNARLEAELSERGRAEKERVSLEEQLRASQKMEAIGSLAGGIAHDFNNLLSVILSYADFALTDLPADHPTHHDLLQVQKAATRAAALTRQLLAFSRKQVLQPIMLDVNQVVTGLEKMLRRILGEDIDFVQVLAPDLGLTLADPGQIEQVLMNLIVNARDAMAKGGKLTIETSNVEVNAELAAKHLAVEPGPFVQLSVSDTGCGMDEQTRSRIFEPFFTTKEKDRGTGLGLSTVYGIIRQSGGNIWVYSEVGGGTTFKIFLPRDISVSTATPIKPSLAPVRTRGTETILVAEDEVALNSIVRRALESAGYKVIAATNGEEALRVSSQYPGEIHLLLTDVVMPKLNGKTLAEQIITRRPLLRIVFMSGYTDEAIVHHGVLNAGVHFLVKPFTAGDLTRKVREVLDRECIPKPQV